MLPRIVDKIADKAGKVSNVIKYTKRVFGTGITLIDNGIKDIIVNTSLENRAISMKVASKKITSQGREVLNFLRSLMTVGLPLMKTVLTPLAKSVFLPLGISVGRSAADVTIQKTLMDQQTQN